MREQGNQRMQKKGLAVSRSALLSEAIEEVNGRQKVGIYMRRGD